MKDIKLTKDQQQKVMDALAEVKNTDGEFDFDVCMDDVTVTLKGYISIFGHRDDDYFMGTGDFVEDYRDACVTLTVLDEDSVEYSANEAEAMACKYLNRAW